MRITLTDARLMQGEHHADSLHLSAGSLPENAEVRLAFLTPRGRRCESPAVELTDGEGDFSLPQSLLDGAGRLLVQLLAETDDRLLKSEVFSFDVERSIDATGETPEEGFFSLSGVCRRLDALAFDLAAFMDETAAALAGKQAALTFDETPTAGSENPVSSGGVKAYVDAAIPKKVSDLTNDAGYQTGSQVAATVRSEIEDRIVYGIDYAYILNKPAVDNAPTAGSGNLVSSGGVKAYVDAAAAPDLSAYATKAYVDAAVSDVDPDLSSLAAVAFSGNYYDLDDRPDIPVVSRDIEADSANYGKAAAAKAVKEFVEGKGYLTQHQSLTDYATKVNVDAAVADVDPDLSSLAAVAFSGNYYDLDDRPDIPVVSRDIEADSANYGKAAAAKAVKEFVEGKGYLTQHQSLNGYATESYVDAAVAAAGGAPELFPVTMDLNLSTMALTNPSATFAETQAAIAAGKLPVVTLSFTGPNGAETANAFLITARSDTLEFTATLRANFGAGNHIYIFILLWTASAATLTPVTLPEKLSDLTNDQNFMTGNQVAATVRSEIEDRIIYGIDYAYILNKPTVDSTPTAGSGNLVSSGGVKSYVDTAVSGAGGAPSTVQTAFTIDATQDKQTITGVTGDLAGVFAKVTNGRKDLVRAELTEGVSGAVLCLPLAGATVTQSSLFMTFSMAVISGSGVSVFTLSMRSADAAPTDGSFYFTPQQMAEMGLPEVYLVFELRLKSLS